MLDALLNSVLPIFAVVGLGYLSGRFGWFDLAGAEALSRFVYFAAVPALLFRLLATADTSLFDWALIGGYIGTEAVLYAAGFLVFRYGFGRTLHEAILLGMASVFTNHLLYLLPIATFRFGDPVAAQMITFVIVDSVVVYGGTLVLLDLTGAGGHGPAGRTTLGRLIRNPQLLGIAAGALAGFLGVPLDNGLGTFVEFLGGAAAPASLFALGVILMAQTGPTDFRVPLTVSALKLAAMPALMGGLLFFAMAPPPPGAGLALLVAAGPSGILPFVLAVRHALPAREVSMAVMLSTVVSLVTVAFVLQGL